MSLNHAVRFWSKVDKRGPEECWPWLAHLDYAGYGSFYLDAKNKRSHRIAYELVNGSIPDSLVIDHLCRNRACVNPAHMEPVTRGENVLRGAGRSAAQARQTHCIHGHEFDKRNTRVHGGMRICLTCKKERNREAQIRRTERHRARAISARPSP